MAPFSSAEDKKKTEKRNRKEKKCKECEAKAEKRNKENRITYLCIYQSGIKRNCFIWAYTF